MGILADTISAWSSLVIPGSLIAILAVSLAVYWLLVKRWTMQRKWVELQEWADANQFKIYGPENPVVPEALRVFGASSPKVLLSLNDPDTAMVQVELSALEPAAAPPSAGHPDAPPAPLLTSPRYNLLVRRIESSWPMTGLRPVAHVNSILDRLALSEFPAMLTGQRFVAYGHEGQAVKTVVKSHLQALIPQDIGLLLVGHSLLLDFSTRPFDHIELQRMDNLAEQLVTHLPMMTKG